MPIDAVRRETRVTLGNTVLPIGKCEAVCSTPVVRKTCIGGEAHTALMEEIPCTVTLTGTLLRRSLCVIVPALHEALTAHTAFAFTLSEVTPDGKAYNMRTSITTLGYRDDLLGERQTYRKGRKVRIEIVALPVVWTVKAGNSLRLDIKSSNFPEYAVHPNRAGVWAEQAEVSVAHQKIFTGSRRNAVLQLPVID